MATRELAPKSPSGRPKRESLTTRNRLRVKNPDPNYVYRIVNDKEDRVEIMKELGYEVVLQSDVKVGDRRVDVGGALGSAATLPVGGGIQGVVMRIPKEWYEESQQEKRAEIARIEETIKPKNLDGTVYGSKLEITRG